MYSKREAYEMHGCTGCTQWDDKEERCKWHYSAFEPAVMPTMCPVSDNVHEYWVEKLNEPVKKRSKKDKEQ